MRGLGPYVKYIPARDQETIVKAVTARRQNAIHRGMLPFIPIDEIETVLCDRNSTVDYQSNAQLQYYKAQAQMQQQQQLAQLAKQQAAMQYQYYPGTLGGPTYAQGIGVSGQAFGAPTTSTYTTTTPSPPLYAQMSSYTHNYPDLQACQFAYSAFLVARAMMIKDDMPMEETEETEETDEIKETLAVAN